MFGCKICARIFHLNIHGKSFLSFFVRIIYIFCFLRRFREDFLLYFGLWCKTTQQPPFMSIFFTVLLPLWTHIRFAINIMRDVNGYGWCWRIKFSHDKCSLKKNNKIISNWNLNFLLNEFFLKSWNLALKIH